MSGFAVRLSPVPLPPPLVQIGSGAPLAHGTAPGVVLEPGVFFSPFPPPPLFLDGHRIPERGGSRDFGTLLASAIGPVVST